MLFYKVSSNHSGISLERRRRKSKNTKGLVVCEIGSDYCEVAERGCCSKKQDQTTVEERGGKKKVKFIKEI